MFSLNGKMYGILFCINFTKKQGSLRTLFLCKLTGFFVKISSGAAAVVSSLPPRTGGRLWQNLATNFFIQTLSKNKIQRINDVTI